MFKKLNFDSYEKSPRINCLCEVHYSKQMKRIVEPYLRKRLTVYELCRKEDHVIHCEFYKCDNPKGIVVISHGFCEPSVRYHETIYYFLKEGYNVYLPEHQGHGYSYRPYFNEKHPDYSLVHVENFSEYVYDLDFLITSLIIPMKEGLPLYLYAHSMGGCIGALYLENHPNVFKKAVLNAPMLQINMGTIPEWFARTLASFMCKIGLKHRYALSQTPFTGTRDFYEYEHGKSYARFNYIFSHTQKTKEYQMHGGSYGWVLQALKATKRALKTSACKKVTTPILMFGAGEDVFVKNHGQLEFMRKVGHGTYMYAKHAKHEMYLAESDFLEKYWGIVFDFLKK
ncbi:Lysophospholipase L2 [Lachnospiraceae bacterium TWA4]|nr:Lysophospholipase L2 [Lachnospiraceae bacterium TWA4]